MKITAVIPQNDHTLYIKADDGQAGLFDITPYLEAEAFAPLKDRNTFEHIHNGRYYIKGTVEPTFLPIRFRRGGSLSQAKTPSNTGPNSARFSRFAPLEPTEPKVEGQ